MTAVTSVTLHGARTDHHARAAVLGALGVVFGDIGTSPLYAFKESLHSAGHGGDPTLGIASLIFWAVLLVVGIKYVFLVMSADTHGEGGTIGIQLPCPQRHAAV